MTHAGAGNAIEASLQGEARGAQACKVAGIVDGQVLAATTSWNKTLVTGENHGQPEEEVWQTTQCQARSGVTAARPQCQHSLRTNLRNMHQND